MAYKPEPPKDIEKLTEVENSTDTTSIPTASGDSGYGGYSIKNVWHKLFVFDVDAKRASLPTAAEHAKQLNEWSDRKGRTIRYMTPEELEALRLDIIEALIKNGTSPSRGEELIASVGKNLPPIAESGESRLCAIVAEITQAHPRGIVWNPETQRWERLQQSPRRRRATIKAGDGPVTAKDMVLKVFPGAKVVGPPPTPEQWAAIEQEAARWRRDAGGVWHKSDNGRGACVHCTNKNVPEWRRGGKLVEARYPDGTVKIQCHYCGRVADDGNNRGHDVRRQQRRHDSDASSPRKPWHLS